MSYSGLARMTTRRPAAILAAGVVDYSRLVSPDEIGVLAMIAF
jgi:hypothetical protein